MALLVRIFLFVILLYSNPAHAFAGNIKNKPAPASAEEFPHCWLENPPMYQPITSIADCQPAIDQIPDGTIAFDGIQQKPLAVHLPPAAREKHILPAIFRSGNCVISVRQHLYKLKYPRFDAASVMYYKVWPEVKRALGRIEKRCLVVPRRGVPRASNAGHTKVRVKLDGWVLEFIFSMAGTLNRDLNRESSRDGPWE